MQHSDRPEFSRLIDEIGDALGAPDRRIVRAKAIYFEHCLDIPIDKVRSAATQAIRTSNTFPTINQLRTYAHAHDDEAQRQAELIEATNRLNNAIRDADTEYERELMALCAYLRGEWRPDI